MRKNIRLMLLILIFFFYCINTTTSYAAATVSYQVTPISAPVAAPHTTLTTPPTPATSTPSTSPPKSNAPIVGKVVWVKGSFKATTPDNQSRVLTKSDPIYLHDTLITENNTQAQIVFTDDSLMTFRPNSTFYINDYSYTKGKSKTRSVGKYIMNLIEGGFRTITGFIAKANPTDYRVNTPVATIGVRGTDYVISLQHGELYIGYYQGSPCVTNANSTLCLNKKTPFANVPNANSAPVPLTQRPDVFQQKLNITNATYADLGPGGPPGGPTTPTGTGTTPPLSPNNITLPSNSIISNFCIQ